MSTSARSIDRLFRIVVGEHNLKSSVREVTYKDGFLKNLHADKKR